MTEEETIPELTPSEITQDNNSSQSAENNPALESVIQAGVYSLTGVDQAVADMDEQNNEGVITIDQDQTEVTKDIENSQINQIEDEPIPNRENRTTNTEKLENDHNEEENDAEPINDNSEEPNEMNLTSQPNEHNSIDSSLQQETPQNDPSLQKDSNHNKQNILDKLTTDISSNLLNNDEEHQQNKSNTQTNETQADFQSQQSVINPLTDLINNVGSLLPDDADQSIPNEEMEEDQSQIPEENNQNENENIEQEDDNEQTEGMNVQDDFKDSMMPTWSTPQPPKIPCNYSVSHLPPLETTPELDGESKRYLQRFEEQGKLPDPDKRTQVLQYIQRQKVNSVVSNDFINAAHLQQVSRKLIQAINVAELGDVQARKMDALEEKLQETLQRLHEFQQQTDEMIKNERERLTIKREDLLNSQEQNLNSFEDHWNDEEFLMRYAKPSSVLLQAKRIERTLVIAKDFEGAEYYKKKVADLEKQESHEAQKRAEREMKKHYRKLTLKQEEDLDAFDAYAKAQLEQLARDREAQLDSLIARQTKLQSEIDEMKALAKKEAKRSSPSRQAQMAALPLLSTGTAKSVDTAMTPRTAQRYAQFKCTIKKPKITIKPLGSINQKRKKNIPPPRF